MMDVERSSRLLVAALAMVLVAGCDGGGEPDAGPPDAGVSPPIVLSVTSATAAAAPGGSQYYALEITLEAREIGPLPIAPNAFTLRLADDSRSIANATATNGAENGCVSQSVPLGESRSCVAVFAVAADAADPVTLDWSNGTRTVTAPVPPIVRP